MLDMTNLRIPPILARTAGCAALAALALPAPLLAQQGGRTPVVQALPSRESLALSSALARLSREPRNVDALVDAGNAATGLGDFEAAVGFFKRAQALSPTNPRLLAGLAGAMVRQGNPAAAIPLFAQAQAAGVPVQTIASDRGLAHDLVGDTANAQKFYAQALAAGGGNEETLRRLAISQAISGDGAAMEKTLLPLLKRQDKPAWRARAFGLAIMGQGKEAGRIVKTLLPGRLAESITPYLQYMPQLTAAQQAAAANLGIFPRASEIGRDQARIAALSPPNAAGETGRGLVPSGKALGPATSVAAAAKPTRQQLRDAEAQARRDAKAAEDRTRREARVALAASKAPRVAPPDPMPTRDAPQTGETQFSLPREAAVPKVAEIMEGRVPAELPAVSTPAARTAATIATTTASVAPVIAREVTAPAATAPAAVPRPQIALAAQPAVSAAGPASAGVSTPGFDLARLPATATPTPAAIATVSNPAPSFGALFADLGKPVISDAPAAGAVDIRKIEPAKPKPKPKPQPVAAKPPPPPSHPSRIWVQLGIGQKVSALTYDWRRLEKADPEVFKGRKPFSAKLNQTNRLLTGPFASQKEAAKYIDALEKAGVNGPYVWVSPAGEVVDDLPR